MSYYDNQQWAVATPSAGPQNWEAPVPRSATSSAVPREETGAFGSQIEEVDRAMDNLVKSGKMFSMQPRRESMPMAAGPARTYPEFDPRMAGAGAPRHHSVSDFGGSDRSVSASNLQNFYATQRHQPPRASEAEQVMQAKRRMAAQRERELRNYHQEQQYNRSVSAELSCFGGKPDRTMSPGSGMSEEERRELIARQKAALYGEGAFAEHNAYIDENGNPVPRTTSGPVASLRGHSPLTFDHFGGAAAAAGTQQVPGQNAPTETPSTESQSAAQPAPSRSRANSTSSPSSNPTPSFGMFEGNASNQPAPRTSTSSPGGSPPPRQGSKAAPGTGVAPIGTRPNGSSAHPVHPIITKQRATTPLPSPLSYSFAASEEGGGNGGSNQASNSNTADRTASSASNPSSATTTTTTATTESVALGWPGKGAATVWGKNPLNVQASVWG